MSQLERMPGGVSYGHPAGGDAPDSSAKRERGRREEIPNSVSIVRCSCPPDVPARRAYVAPRKMIPTAAMKSAKPSVDAIEPKAAGYAVQTTVSTR